MRLPTQVPQRPQDIIRSSRVTRSTRRRQDYLIAECVENQSMMMNRLIAITSGIQAIQDR